MTRPLLHLALCLAGGACLGAGLSRPAALALLLMAVLLLALALLARPAPWSLLALGSAALALGAAAAAVEDLAYRGASVRRWLSTEVEDEPFRLAGRLLRDPWPAGERQTLLFELEELAWRGRSTRASGRARI